MSRNYTTNRNNPFISEFLTNEAYPVCPYFSTSRNIAGFYGICAYLIISNIAIIVLVVFLNDVLEDDESDENQMTLRKKSVIHPAITLFERFNEEPIVEKNEEKEKEKEKGKTEEENKNEEIKKDDEKEEEQKQDEE
ncbi:unnamed protein product [Caenorhabditis angaria]|uniref:Uncharacterized protein n=1 Tax=Caenorhabditis angaria TaxID=860376 RepID=A0A9P1IJM8_9PELO|nr:unnamed protein product [Caenorhabditis angaria]